MNNISRLLFKKNRPVLRPFEPISEAGAGDAPYLWDAYLKGLLKDTPEGMNMEQFANFIMDVTDQVTELWMVEDYIEDELRPTALIFASHDGWLLEPHVIHFDNATPRIILRTWVAFLKKRKHDKKTGACLLRVEKDSVNLCNHLEKLGLIEWVGKIWGGRPSGNEYLYSMRCKARGSKA